MDVALFLLTFMYKQDQEEDNIKPHLDPVWLGIGQELGRSGKGRKDETWQLAQKQSDNICF